MRIEKSSVPTLPFNLEPTIIFGNECGTVQVIAEKENAVIVAYWDCVAPSYKNIDVFLKAELY